MRNFIRIAGLIWVMVGLLGLSITDTVGAVPATFKQQILPLDCVFQIVNDGSGTIVYLTPAQCGQVIEVPPTTGTETGTNTPTPLPAVFTRVETGNGAVEFPFLPGADPATSRFSTSLGNAQYLPYAPLSSLNDEQNITQQKQLLDTKLDLTSIPAPVIAVSTITLILVILLFFL